MDILATYLLAYVKMGVPQSLIAPQTSTIQYNTNPINTTDIEA